MQEVIRRTDFGRLAAFVMRVFANFQVIFGARVAAAIAIKASLQWLR
jgi:hypothetical protein